jgi:hypothetical protein
LCRPFWAWVGCLDSCIPFAKVACGK